MNEWESAEIGEDDGGQATAIAPTNDHAPGSIKGQGKVYFDRGGGWFIIGLIRMPSSIFLLCP